MNDVTASPEDLAADLAGILRTGVTLAALERCPHVLSLDLAQAKTASQTRQDRAVAAGGLIREAAIVVDDGNPSGAHAVLLALAPGFRGTLLKQRRHQVAELLGVTADHVRDYREDGLIEDVADELYAMDSAYRLRHKHRTKREREPTETATGVNWLERHEAYRRIWTPIAALRDDLATLLGYLREGTADWPDLADRLMSMTWRYAQFSRELERFIEDYGGLWLLADIDAEIAAADAIRRIDLHVPFGEADSSWLRLILKETPKEELDPFIDRMLAEDRGHEVLAVWMDWALECGCKLNSPDPAACEVHTWVAAADQFIGLIDDDWYRVADWYRALGNEEPQSA